jgi:tRNA(fMet)-specific endonuclease VapC
MDYQYLLDTNTASYIIKGNRPVLDQHLAKIPTSRIAVSVVTEGELRFGAARLPHAAHLHRVLEEFFLRVAILPWDSNAARQYGHLRAALEREGRLMGNLDIMSAAQALALELIVVTSDQAFRRIKKLKVEDWTRREG